MPRVFAWFYWPFELRHPVHSGDSKSSITTRAIYNCVNFEVAIPDGYLTGWYNCTIVLVNGVTDLRMGIGRDLQGHRYVRIALAPSGPWTMSAWDLYWSRAESVRACSIHSRHPQLRKISAAVDARVFCDIHTVNIKLQRAIYIYIYLYREKMCMGSQEWVLIPVQTRMNLDQKEQPENNPYRV